MLIVGMTGSGKTQFLLNMLETEYNRVFDYIIIVCPTIEWNTTYLNWSHLSDNGVIQIPCSQEMINNVLQAVSTIFRGTNTLIVVDDCASSQAVKKRVSELVRLAFSARHYNLSVIVLTQQLSSVAKPFRENISRLVTFYNPSRKDMKVITDDYLNGVPQETITEITKILRDEKFTALDIHYYLFTLTLTQFIKHRVTYRWPPQNLRTNYLKPH
jgi:cellulose biosynthesis protein BcsQ